MPVKLPISAQVPEGQPLKKSFDDLMTVEERAVFDSAIALIDRHKLPVMERSGNQKYVKMDSSKDPYTNFYTITDEYDVNIYTDGKRTNTASFKTDGGEVVQNYKVEKYNYILVKYTKKGKCINQHLVTKEYRVQLYFRHKLGMALG